MYALLALLGAGALAFFWMRGSAAAPTTPQWFASAVPAAATPELARLRESGIDAVLELANKNGTKLLVSFPIRRASEPAKYSLGVQDILAYGIAQKIYLGKTPSGTEGRLYDVKITSFLGTAPDLPAVGTVLTLGSDSIASISEYKQL